jgi:hypothetical protein
MEPIKILEPQKRMPFTLAVFMRLLVLIPVFGVSILMIVTGYQELQEFGKMGLFSFIPGIFLFVFSLFSLIRIFVLKRLKLSQLNYLFYADRLVIYNHSKDQILHELLFLNFPPFTFHENLNNFGFIVIGIEEPIFAQGGIFKLKVGVNMKDPEIMLENLPEVKKEYLFLKELVEESVSK